MDVVKTFPGEPAPPAVFAANAAAVAWYAPKGPLFGMRVAARPGSPLKDPLWNREVVPGTAQRYPGAFGLDATASGLYVKSLGDLFFFDTAKGREVVYQLPDTDNPRAPGAPRHQAFNQPPPHYSRLGAPAKRTKTLYGTHILFAFWETGDTLATVCGWRGELEYNRYRKDVNFDYVPIQTKFYLDLFDRGTGRHLARQELTGPVCTPFHHTGRDPNSACILNGAVLLTDAAGLHLFAPAR
jgi:hypothetical protein